MKTAIVGLPMTGKTSLFTILTGVHETTRMGSTEARIGITRVPDLRLDALAKIYEPPKVTHAHGRVSRFPIHLQGSFCATRAISAACASPMPLPTSSASSKTIPFRTRRAASIRCAMSRTWTSN